MGYIYKITCKVNNKVYIGLTQGTIEGRFGGHLDQLEYFQECLETNQKPAYKSKLYPAMIKYGIENFIVEEIDHSDSIEELNNKEKYWIAYFNAQDDECGYNICSGGKGHTCEPWNKGKKGVQKPSQKALDVLAKGSHLPASEKQKQQLAARRKGIQVTEETRQKLREKASGYKWMVCDNNKPLQVKLEDVNLYIAQGYQLGMKYRN